MKTRSFVDRLPVVLVVLLIAFTAKAGFIINSGLEELTTYHSPTLISIQQMESHIFEGIAESFSYILLNDEGEKEDFFEKSDNFDIAAEAFQEFARYQEEELVEEEKAFQEVLSAKEAFVANVEKMFEDFERLGSAPSESVIAVEASVHELTKAMNHLVEVEKLELDEHVEELEGIVFMEVTLLLILSVLLLIVLMKKRGKKK